MPNLRELLSAQGVACAELAGTEGGRLLVTNSSARLLSLTTGDGGEHLWQHEALAAGEPVPARASDGWVNMGGDRIWLAPELDFFVSDRARLEETYAVPAAIDPGAYALEVGETEARLRAECTLRDHARGVEFRCVVDTAVRMAAHPLRDLRAPELCAGVSYLGYMQTTTLALIYFGTPAPGELDETRAGLRLRVDRRGPLKIGVPAVVSTGRMGYLRATGADTAALLVRNFPVDPSGVFVDTPWDDPTGTELGCCRIRRA